MASSGMIWMRRCGYKAAHLYTFINVILNALKLLDLNSFLSTTIGLQILTLYLFSPICSTWNLLAHLHWATCLVTWDKKVDLIQLKHMKSILSWQIYKIHHPYLILDLISICCGSVSIFVGVQSSHKFIIVDVAIAIAVKDISNSCHLQPAGRELCKQNA